MDWKNRLHNICEKMKGQMHASNIDDCQRLYEMISKFDKNGDGVLNMKEFEAFLKSQNQFLTTQEMRHIVDCMGGQSTTGNKFNMTNASNC